MSHTTASRYQLDVETYLAGTLNMVQFPSDLDSKSQVLAPATEYFSVLVQQDSINRQQDANEGLVSLAVKLRLLYRFTTNEAEYTGSGSTPTKMKAALAAIMDEKWWRGGSFTPTAPLSVSQVDSLELSTQRLGRVIETEIQLSLVTASV